MKITAIVVDVLELPGQKTGTLEIVQVPGLRRTQYTHRSRPTERPAQLMLMRVQTDAGVEGCSTYEADGGDPVKTLELLRANVIGEDAFKREAIFQKLQLGTRWVYQKPGWFGTLDNCLWDIAGKVAGLPVYQLIGQMRERMPVYRTAGDGPLEMFIEHIEQGRELGIRAYKPHSYKGGKADIPIMTKLREHVGSDYDLMLDPVCSYTPREALEVGRVLEELDFVWLEEPFHEQRMSDYQALCAELNLPILATEMLMHDMGLTAQWLIQGATDLLRANARHGTTQVLKLAHLAELHGTTVELNGQGGLFGLVHVHLGCSIANNSYYEHFAAGRRVTEAGLLVGLTNTPEVVEGCLMPPSGPGWGAEWDQALLRKRTVATL